MICFNANLFCRREIQISTNLTKYLLDTFPFIFTFPFPIPWNKREAWHPRSASEYIIGANRRAGYLTERFRLHWKTEENKKTNRGGCCVAFQKTKAIVQVEIPARKQEKQQTRNNQLSLRVRERSCFVATLTASSCVRMCGTWCANSAVYAGFGGVILWNDCHYGCVCEFDESVFHTLFKWTLSISWFQTSLMIFNTNFAYIVELFLLRGLFIASHYFFPTL